MNSNFATPVDYAEWLADKMHNTNDYGKEAAQVLVRQAKEIAALESTTEFVGYMDEFGNFEKTMQNWMREEPGVNWEPVYRRKGK